MSASACSPGKCTGLPCVPLRGFLLPLILFCGSLAVAAVLKRGGHQVMVGGMDLGVMSAFISYAVGIIEPVVEIAGVITDIMAAQVCIERVTALLDEPCLIEDTAEVKEKYGDSFEPKTENWEPIRGDVTFDHVWFKYPDGGDWVLEDFSLHIPAGTTVAIVGETGAGKSTLVNLACRFYEPTEGRVLIDGRDSRERSQLWLHSSLGCVLQDPAPLRRTFATGGWRRRRRTLSAPRGSYLPIRLRRGCPTAIKRKSARVATGSPPERSSSSPLPGP